MYTRRVYDTATRAGVTCLIHSGAQHLLSHTLLGRIGYRFTSTARETRRVKFVCR